MYTIANLIAARFHDDGQRFRDNLGVSIEDTCLAQASSVHAYGDDRVYVFADGSALAVTEGGWDVVVPYLGGWASAARDGTPDPRAFTFGLEEE